MRISAVEFIPKISHEEREGREDHKEEGRGGTIIYVFNHQ
ncbi:hypothetical protein R84B8_01622 [Treponema sp. R8-4-B8]